MYQVMDTRVIIMLQDPYSPDRTASSFQQALSSDPYEAAPLTAPPFSWTSPKTRFQYTCHAVAFLRCSNRPRRPTFKTRAQMRHPLGAYRRPEALPSTATPPRHAPQEPFSAAPSTAKPTSRKQKDSAPASNTPDGHESPTPVRLAEVIPTHSRPGLLNHV